MELYWPFLIFDNRTKRLDVKEKIRSLWTTVKGVSWRHHYAERKGVDHGQYQQVPEKWSLRHS